VKSEAQQFVRENEKSIIEDLRAARSGAQPTQWYWSS
jgi:hypothetical protein